MDYLGTCVDIDEDGDNYGFDATEFAQADDRADQAGIDVPMEKFLPAVEECIPPDLEKQCKECEDPVTKYWCAYDEELNVSCIYDIDEDIHYIFSYVPESIKK